jgi:ubiquinone/menaquinone biosynthesis C-methylase UbiE
MMKIDYSAIADDYDSFRSNSPEYLEILMQRCDIKPSSRVLDLGCGTGTAAGYITKSTSARVVGVDASIGMLQTARSKDDSLPYVNADAARLPFPDGSFDAIYSIYMLHHLPDPLPAVQECFRVLKRGQLVLVTSSHRQIESYHPKLQEFFPDYVGIDKQRFHDIPVLKKALKQAGFKDISTEESTTNRVDIDKSLIQKIECKYVSTYHLIPTEKFKAGLQKLKQFVATHKGPPLHQYWNCTLITARK